MSEDKKDKEMGYRAKLFNLQGNFSEGKKLFGIHEEKDQVTIMIHGVIGDSRRDMDSNAVVSAIHEAHGKLLVFDINTPGGFVFDAISIHSATVEHVGGSRADITGAAESSGTIVAAGVDKIRIAQAGIYTLHNAWTVAMGNKRQLAEMSSQLEVVDGALAELLADRSGMSVEDVLALMDGTGPEGTTFTGAEAVEKGFADELIPNKKKAAAKAKTHFRRYSAVAALNRLKVA